MGRTKMVWIAMEDDDTAAKLLELARRHVKLALEHGRANTSPDRRKAIGKEIQALRAVRESMINQYVGNGGEPYAE